MSVFGSVVDIVKRHFISGVLVVVPIILTYLVLRFLFTAIDGILQPVIYGIFGYYLPGLGLVTTLLVIILAGFFTRNFVGAKLYRLGDRLLARMPLIRPIYLSAKQVLTAVTNSNGQTFKEVCMLEYPRRGVWVLGFISGLFEADLGQGPNRYASVFIGSTPTPITGWVVIVLETDLTRVNMSVEEGIKFLVSGGVVSPVTMKPKAVEEPTETGEMTK